MNSRISLSGKTALVTGGGTGIGKAIALEFAANGCKVAVNYNRSRSEAESTVREILEAGGSAAAIQADVTKEDQVERLIKDTLAFSDRIDILVNNAGTMVQRSRIDEMDLSLWLNVMDVNLTSVFLMCKHTAQVMKQQQYGRIINISSIAAHMGGSIGSVAYATSKGAVHTFTKGLAKELISFGILVNAIAPGVIATRFHDQYSSDEMRQNFKKIIPLGREGTADEVSGAAMLLASDYGSFIIGEMIEVNGGQLMD